MPEFDLGDLWWLKKRDWLDEPNSALIGLQLAQKQQQQNRDFALRVSQFDLQKKEADVQMHGQLLNQQLAQSRLDDEAEMSRAFTAKEHGQEIEPNLKLGSSQERWMRLNTMRETQSGNQQEWSDLLKDFNALDGDAKAQVRQDTINAGGTWPPKPGQILPETYHSASAAQDEMLRKADDRTMLRFKAQEVERGKLEETKQQAMEQRQLAVEELRQTYQASMRSATSILGKAKLLSYQNELHQISFDPSLASAQKSKKTADLNARYGVSPDFRQTGAVSPATESEPDAFRKALTEVNDQIDEVQVDLAKTPAKSGLFGGKDSRETTLENLQAQKQRLQQKLSSPEAKAALANRVAKEHPDWSRQQIIDEVTRQVP